MRGRALIAHELTHVVQQGEARSPSRLQAKDDPSAPKELAPSRLQEDL